jgi:hypothetical protein
MNTTTKFFARIIITSIALMPACLTAGAAEVAGHVQFILGNVQIGTADGQMRDLKKGDAVSEGDVVSTAASSSAQIKMNDGGFIAVRPDTKMKFEKFVFKGAKKGEERSFFSLFKGGFRAVTGLIGKTNKQNYRITTAAASIGIRGTDHETFYVPEGNALVPAGAYSKVNVGETTITTNRGTINVLPNQMGFASGMNELPKLAPINTSVFTVSAAPAKSIKESKTDKSNQAGTGNAGGTAQTAKQDAKPDTSAANNNAESSTNNVAATTSDTTSSPPVSSAATSSSGNNVTIVSTASTTTATDNLSAILPATIVPIVLTNVVTGTTLNVTTQSNTPGGIVTSLIPAVAYAGNNIALEMMSYSNYGYGKSSGMLIAPSGLTYVAGGSSASGALQTYIEQKIGGGANSISTSTISGGAANSSNAPSFATTGIQYGSWTGYTSQTNSTNFSLSSNSGNQTNWMYAPQGYVDSANWGSTFAVGTLGTGTYTYTLAGAANAPRYQNSGAAGTLTSASIVANFAAMTVTANLGLNIGTDFWGASLSNAPISSNAGVGGSFGAYSGSLVGGTWAVSHGATTTTACSTCSGSISGMFTGLNFSGAMLSYYLYDTAQGNSVFGDAAFTQSAGVVAGGTSISPGTIIVETGNGSLSVIPAGSVFTSANGVLTQYVSSNVAGTVSNVSNVSNVSTVTVSCLACTPAGFTTGGIYWGNWSSGTFSATSVTSIPAGSISPAYWITGPEAGPLYLPQALTGTATYALDAGQVSSTATGNTGTVNGATSLNVNFNNQTVGITVNASINDAAGLSHTWNALASSVPLTGNQGIGGGAFHIGTGGSLNSGLLAVTVDGTTSGNGMLDGQLTGSGLTGAIISYSLSVTSLNAGYTDNLNGVAAFSSVAQNINTAYQSVLMSTYDPSTLIPNLGFYFNSPAHIAQDATGNLTKFDTNYVNSGSNGNVTLSNTGSTLTDFGTDPVSGISWGRWSGGTLNVTNRATVAVTPSPLNGSLHWITEPVTTGAVTLPIAGTYTYTLAGGTKPTDNLGNVGTLNSASVTANFTAQTVNLGVNATVAGATVNAAAANAPIIQNTVFYASSTEPSTSSSYLNVSCTGSCSGATGGTVIGKFTGAAAVGVAMAYGLQNGASSINGVAALHR